MKIGLSKLSEKVLKFKSLLIEDQEQRLKISLLIVKS